MKSRTKLGIALVLAVAAVSLVAFVLAVHGVSLTPLDEVGGTPH